VKIYRATLPAIIRSGRRFTIVSTPLGQSGPFYSISTDIYTYSNYSRHQVPWYEASIMVKPGYYEEALALAAELPTVDRVEKYGSEKLIEIYKGYGSDIQGFQTEFECTFVDETEAYYPWELIVDCREDDAPIWKEWPENYEPQGELAIGVDLAKSRDKSVFTVTEFIKIDDQIHRFVRFIHATQASYEDQFDYLKRLIARVKPSRVTIDQTGVGAVFVERMNRERFSFGGEVNIEGVVFTNQKKEKWATTLKGEMQDRRIHFLPDNDLIRQTHGIRRTKTESNFYRFAGAQDDFFWSAILSFYGEGRIPTRFAFV